MRPASGMATALDPMMLACGGTWVAHGSGDADRLTVDADDRVRVPPENPRYTLRRVWLTKEQEEGYYHGLANSGLWPLCHIVFTRPIFDPGHWRAYREVNELFAEAVLEEAGDGPAFVFIQDYHFGLLPRMLKRRNPNLTVAQFWHIPWPNPETFRAFPWKEELLDGLLGNDLLGFHLSYHCQNFLETVDRNLESRTDRETSEVQRGGHSTRVRPFPISIDFERQSAAAASAEVEREVVRWRHRLKLERKVLGLGIERVDYTKGIPERLRAIDRLLETRPEYRGRLVFAQVGVPSRGHIRAYQQLDDEIDALVEKINWRWGTGAWRPIVYEKRHFNQVEMMALHRLARFLRRQLAARRDEPGRQGVRLQPGRRGRGAHPEPVHRRRPGADRRGAGQPVRRRGAVRRDARGAVHAPRGARAADAADARGRGREQRLPLGGEDRLDAPADRPRRRFRVRPARARRPPLSGRRS